MSVRKVGGVYHYDFIFQAKRYQGTTGQLREARAKDFERKLRSDLYMASVGLMADPTEVKEQAPTGKEFLSGRFLDYIRQECQAKPLTIRFYEEKTRALLGYSQFADNSLDQIDENLIQEFKQWRAKQPKKKAGAGTIAQTTINAELKVLRRALIRAHKWGLIPKLPQVETIPGEKGREFVLTGEMETLYLSRCSSPLREAATLMLECGLRPEECVSLRKADVTEDSIFIRTGKTKNARRVLPVTLRARQAVQTLFDLWPKSEWLFPGLKEGRHLTREALEHAHARVRETKSGAITKSADESVLRVRMVPDVMAALTPEPHAIFPREFVLYSLRHTYGTRLAESGAQAWEIQRLMGHHSISVSEKYIHLSAEHLTLAMRRKEAYDLMLRGETQVDSLEVKH